MRIVRFDLKKLHSSLQEQIDALKKRKSIQTTVTSDVEWDNIDFVYTGDDITQIILYYNGAIVKTVNLTYSGSDVTVVESIFANGKIETVAIDYTGSKLNEVTKEIS